MTLTKARATVLGTLMACSANAAAQTTQLAADSQAPTAASALAFQFRECGAGMPESGMWKCDPLIADFDDNGLPDVAALARLGDGPHVWLGDGSGTWTDSSRGLRSEDPSCGGGLACGDVNSDGIVDLFVADHCNGIFVFAGAANGEWTPLVRALTPVNASMSAEGAALVKGTEDIAVGDVNGDGHLDIIAAASDEGGINVYLGDGSGRVWQLRSEGLPRNGWANRILLRDMNGDQRPDIVASYSLGPRVWLNVDGSAWKDSSIGLPSPAIAGLFHGLDVGDMNEDGRQDIAVANWVDGPEVYLQAADGRWSRTPDVFPAMLGGAVGLATGDINSDGHLDIIVAGRLTQDGGFVRGVFLLTGNGQGQWTYASDCGLPSTGLAATPGLAVADVNRDGRSDVIACSGLLVETPGNADLAKFKPTLDRRILIWCNDSGHGNAPGKE